MVATAVTLVLALVVGTVVIVAEPASARTPFSTCGSSPLTTSYLAEWNARANAGDVGISVSDVTTGCTFGSHDNETFLSASVVKLQIMGAVLLALQDSNAPVSSYLDGLLTDMIQYSDNEAATELVSWLGGLGQLQVVGERFDLVDTDNVWASDWGSTLTTPADQTKLMTELVVRGGPLTAPSRLIARSYLGGVAADQRWGVGAIQGPGLHALVKNGWWLNEPGGNGIAFAWRLNSVGLIEADDGRAWSIAILGNGWNDESDEHFIDELAQHIADVVTQKQITTTVPLPAPTTVRGALQHLEPIRLLDTRDLPTPGIASGGIVAIDVRQGGVVPVAVALNLTAVNPKDAGFLTVYPSQVSRPETSNLNIVPGRTVANFAVTPVGSDGTVRVYTYGRTDLIVDLVGQWLSTADTPVAAGRFRSLAPTRVLDTRSQLGAVRAGATRSVKVAGQGEVPLSASAVAVSVTVTAATADGFWTVWGSNTPQPKTSNVNVRQGDTIANTTIVTPGSDGNVQIYSQSGGQVIVDVVGWYTGSDATPGVDGLLAPLAAPVRLVDSRSAIGSDRLSPLPTVLHVGTGTGFVGNFTWIAPGSVGFVTVWPSGRSQPITSVANPDPRIGSAFANALVMGVGDQFGINVSSSIPVDWLIDVSAVFT